MAIRLICMCGLTMNLPEKYAGQHVQCPDCRAMLRIPTESEDQELVRWFCRCGQRLKARRRTAGKRVKCPACGEDVQAPSIEVRRAISEEEYDLDEGSGVVRLTPRAPSGSGEERTALHNLADLPGPQGAPPVPPLGARGKEARHFSRAEPPGVQGAPPPILPPEEEEKLALDSLGDEDEEVVYELTAPAAPAVLPPPPPPAGRTAAAPLPPNLEPDDGRPHSSQFVFASEADEEEGIRAQDLARYFNSTTGKDAAVAGVTQVLNGHWLYLPYALLAACAANLLAMAREASQGNPVLQVTFGLLSLVVTVYLWGAFVGCIKDGVFERAMGVERLAQHGLVNFGGFGLTLALMAPVGIALGFAGALLTGALWAALPGLAKVFAIAFAVAFGMFFFVLLILPPVVFVVERTNPVIALLRGLRFGFSRIGALISLCLVSFFIGGGVVLAVCFFFWLARLLLLLILPAWLFEAVYAIMGGLAAAAIMGQLTSSAMLFYLSHLDEERLQRIHARLSGPQARPPLLYAAIAFFLVAALGLSYLRSRSVGVFRWGGGQARAVERLSDEGGSSRPARSPAAPRPLDRPRRRP